MKIRFLLCGMALIAALWPTVAGRAQTTTRSASQVLEQAQNDVAAARDALQVMRRETQAARSEWVDRRSALEHEVAALRKRKAALEEDVARRQQQEVEFRRRAREASLLRDRCLESLLGYRKNAEARLSPGSRAMWGEEVKTLDAIFAANELDGFRTFQATLSFAQALREAARQPVPHPGTFVGPGGEVREGALLTRGPRAWGDGVPLVLQSDSLLPRQVRPPARPGDVPGNWLPLDVSRGQILRDGGGQQTRWERMKSGGGTMIPLALVGLAAIGISIFKTIQLLWIREASEQRIQEVGMLMDSGKKDAAMELVRSIRGPARTILEEGVACTGTSRAYMEEVMVERILLAAPSLERGLGFLAVLGGVAPLLGLLGTVTGMIHTFQAVTLLGNGEAQLLSGGISEALITTETGLMIAVPVLLVHALLKRRVQRVVQGLEHAASHLLHAVGRPAIS